MLLAQSTFVDSLSTNEKLISQLKTQFTLTQFDGPNIIMPFNKDTILIAGYLSDFSVGNSPKNVVYRTLNGGTTWEMKKFKGDAWIYCSHFEKEGKIWMGGSDEVVHYSNDYGATWTQMPKPFSPSDRVLSIYMTDSNNGIAGGLSNGFALTTDNWMTCKQIQSPLDQQKFKILKNSARNRIDKVEVLDSIILVNQNDHIYYSKINPIAWKEFNIPVSDFSVDKISKQWSIYSLRNKVYVLSTRLDLLKTYVKPNEDLKKEQTPGAQISLNDFFSSGFGTLKITAVKYDFDRMAGGCIQFPVYKANSKNMELNDAKKLALLKEILDATGSYQKPLSQSFLFTQQDYASYEDFYNEKKKKNREEKVWGGDFTSLLNIENDYFLNPKQTVASINQALLDTVYNNTFSSSYLSPYKNAPFITLDLVNSKSDTLKITSKGSKLFSLPWTIEYKGQSFQTYDPKINEYLKTILPKGYNYYDDLFAGELIYKLIEQRTINELEYKSSY